MEPRDSYRLGVNVGLQSPNGKGVSRSTINERQRKTTPKKMDRNFSKKMERAAAAGKSQDFHTRRDGNKEKVYMKQGLEITFSNQDRGQRETVKREPGKSTPSKQQSRERGFKDSVSKESPSKQNQDRSLQEGQLEGDKGNGRKKNDRRVVGKLVNANLREGESASKNSSPTRGKSDSSVTTAKGNYTAVTKGTATAESPKRESRSMENIRGDPRMSKTANPPETSDVERRERTQELNDGAKGKNEQSGDRDGDADDGERALNSEPDLDKVERQLYKSFEEQEAELERTYIFKLTKKSSKFPRAKFYCRLCNYHIDTHAQCWIHIDQSRHDRLAKAKESEMFCKNLPSPTKAHAKALTKLLQEVVEEHALTGREMNQRSDLADRLEGILQNSLEDCKVKLYGSSLSSFGFHESDVNLDVEVPNEKQASKVLLAVSKAIGERVDKDFTDFEADFEGKHACVRFRDKKTGLLCELGTANQNAVQSSQLMVEYNQCDYRLRPLVMGLRYWARLCGIDQQALGAMPAHTFVLLVIYFLQQCKPPVLPVIQQNEKFKTKNEQSIGELWVELLRFYLVGINIEEIVISIRQRELVYRADLKIPSRRIAIEDPFANGKKTLAKSITTSSVFKYIMDRFHDALKYFGMPPSRWSSSSEEGEISSSSEARKSSTSKEKSSKSSSTRTEDSSNSKSRESVVENGPCSESVSHERLYNCHSAEDDKSEESRTKKNLYQSGPRVLSVDDNEPDQSRTDKCVGERSGTCNSNLNESEDNAAVELSSMLAKIAVSEAESEEFANRSSNSDLELDERLCLSPSHREGKKNGQKMAAESTPKRDSGNIPSIEEIVNIALPPSEDEADSDFVEGCPKATSRLESNVASPLGSNSSSMDQSRSESVCDKSAIVNNVDSSFSDASKSRTIENKQAVQSSDQRTFDTQENSDSTRNKSGSKEGSMEKSNELGMLADCHMKHEENRRTEELIEEDEEDFVFVFDKEILTSGEEVQYVCTSCMKEGHISKFCPEDTLPPLNDLPPMDPIFLEHSTVFCDQILIRHHPNAIEVRSRDQCVRELEYFIRQLAFPDAQLTLFGSSGNGFGFRMSDLDICLTFRNRDTAQGIDIAGVVEQLASTLRRNRSLYNIVAIPTAKVPIVKFVHRPTRLEGDISLYNTLAQCNTRLLNAYSQIDVRVKKLGYAMKYLAKMCDIGDASRGSLSSYAYTLLTIFFLQQRKPPVLPVLQEMYSGKEPPVHMVDGCNAWFFYNINQLPRIWKDYGRNSESVGSLWLGMLRFYTEDFDFTKNVVSIRRLLPLTRFEKMWMTPIRGIAIEDPFDLDHNLGGAASKKMAIYIIQVFRNARDLFGTPCRIPSMGPRPGREDIMRYFHNIDELTGGEAPPNDRGCKICGKIGHFVKDCPIKLRGKERRDRDRRDSERERENKENGMQSPSRSNAKQEVDSPQRGGKEVPSSPPKRSLLGDSPLPKSANQPDSPIARVQQLSDSTIPKGAMQPDSPITRVQRLTDSPISKSSNNQSGSTVTKLGDSSLPKSANQTQTAQTNTNVKQLSVKPLMDAPSEKFNNNLSPSLEAREKHQNQADSPGARGKNSQPVSAKTRSKPLSPNTRSKPVSPNTRSKQNADSRSVRDSSLSKDSTLSKDKQQPDATVRRVLLGDSPHSRDETHPEASFSRGRGGVNSSLARNQQQSDQLVQKGLLGDSPFSSKSRGHLESPLAEGNIKIPQHESFFSTSSQPAVSSPAGKGKQQEPSQAAKHGKQTRHSPRVNKQSSVSSPSKSKSTESTKSAKKSPEQNKSSETKKKMGIDSAKKEKSSSKAKPKSDGEKSTKSVARQLYPPKPVPVPIPKDRDETNSKPALSSQKIPSSGEKEKENSAKKDALHDQQQHQDQQQKLQALFQIVGKTPTKGPFSILQAPTQGPRIRAPTLPSNVQTLDEIERQLKEKQRQDDGPQKLLPGAKSLEQLEQQYRQDQFFKMRLQGSFPDGNQHGQGFLEKLQQTHQEGKSIGQFKEHQGQQGQLRQAQDQHMDKAVCPPSVQRSVSDSERHDTRQYRQTAKTSPPETQSHLIPFEGLPIQQSQSQPIPIGNRYPHQPQQQQHLANLRYPGWGSPTSPQVGDHGQRQMLASSTDRVFSSPPRQALPSSPRAMFQSPPKGFMQWGGPASVSPQGHMATSPPHNLLQSPPEASTPPLLHQFGHSPFGLDMRSPREQPHGQPSTGNLLSGSIWGQQGESLQQLWPQEPNVQQQHLWSQQVVHDKNKQDQQQQHSWPDQGVHDNSKHDHQQQGQQQQQQQSWQQAVHEKSRRDQQMLQHPWLQQDNQDHSRQERQNQHWPQVAQDQIQQEQQQQKQHYWPRQDENTQQQHQEAWPQPIPQDQWRQKQEPQAASSLSPKSPPVDSGSAIPLEPHMQYQKQHSRSQQDQNMQQHPQQQPWSYDQSRHLQEPLGASQTTKSPSSVIHPEAQMQFQQMFGQAQNNSQAFHYSPIGLNPNLPRSSHFPQPQPSQQQHQHQQPPPPQQQHLHQLGQPASAKQDLYQHQHPQQPMHYPHPQQQRQQQQTSNWQQLNDNYHQGGQQWQQPQQHVSLTSATTPSNAVSGPIMSANHGDQTSLTNLPHH